MRLVVIGNDVVLGQKLHDGQQFLRLRPSIRSGWDPAKSEGLLGERHLFQSESLFCLSWNLLKLRSSNVNVNLTFCASIFMLSHSLSLSARNVEFARFRGKHSGKEREGRLGNCPRIDGDNSNPS